MTGTQQIRLVIERPRSPRHSDDDRVRRLLWLGWEIPVADPAGVPEPEIRRVLGCFVPDPDPVFPEGLR